MQAIQQNLHHLSETIRLLEKKYHRPPHSVSLLAISKGQALEKIQAAVQAGQKAFGENYVQEALPKMEALNADGLEWHFTGHLQSNKTRQVAELFSWVHTVSSQKQAQHLNDHRPETLPALQICLEVNVSQEPSKSGVIEFSELKTLAEFCTKLPRLQLRGLMTVPAPKAQLEEQRAELHKLVMMKDRLEQEGFKLDTLSMGMTADLEAAIAEGSTILRIGTGLFGPRS